MSDLKTNLQEILQDKNTNLLPENLKAGVTCLGVEGTLEEGIDTSDATATADDIADSKTAYVNGQKITGSVLTVEDAYGFGVPTENNVSIDETQLHISSSADTNILLRNGVNIHSGATIENVAITAGLTSNKLVEGNTVLGVEGTAIELKGQTKSVTPTTNLQTIIPDENYNGLTSVEVSAVTSDIDENIKAENIKSGIEILGVTGTLESGTGIDTSDATATASDIAQNKTAYVNGEKITGILPLFPNSRTFTVDGGVTNDTENNRIQIRTINTTKQILDSNLNMEFNGEYTDVADAIGLTAGKIKSGEIILGLEGTVEDVDDYISLPEGETSITIADCIKQIPQLDTSNVTNMSTMFQGCIALTTIPQLDTSAVTIMSYMFQNCTALTTIPQLDTSAVTIMSYMFQNCTALTTIPQLDTSAVTIMSYMFQNCTALTTIPQLDTSTVTDMDYMFRGCTVLTTIPLLNTSNVTSMRNMFQNCTSLSDDSLNNILAMLTNATAFTGTKTLAYIGLSETQATTCTTLSNWSACEAAGWTTGY